MTGLRERCYWTACMFMKSTEIRDMELNWWKLQWNMADRWALSYFTQRMFAKLGFQTILSKQYKDNLQTYQRMEERMRNLPKSYNIVIKILDWVTNIKNNPVLMFYLAGLLLSWPPSKHIKTSMAVYACQCVILALLLIIGDLPIFCEEGGWAFLKVRALGIEFWSQLLFFGKITINNVLVSDHMSICGIYICL